MVVAALEGVVTGNCAAVDMVAAGVAAKLGSGSPVVEGAGSVIALPSESKLGSIAGPGKV